MPKSKPETRKSSKSGKTQSTKLELMINLLDRKSGVTIAELVKATGWQAHSVRGAISSALKKKRGLNIVSAPDTKLGRVYRITGGN